MTRRPLRVAIMLDLQWPYKRHSEVFAGVQQYAVEQGWISIIDEFADDTLRRKSGRGGAVRRHHREGDPTPRQACG
jgi:LacI family transcriptional regulator